MNTWILYFCINYSICDLICDIISWCVWNFDTNKFDVYAKIVIENIKRENMEIKVIFT